MKRLLVVATLFLASCSAPAPLYVKADRATFDAVAPDYLRYVENDESLTEAEKSTRQRTVATWKLRLEAAEEQGR